MYAVDTTKEDIFVPLHKMKVAVSRKEVTFTNVLDEKALSFVKILLSTYPINYKFEKNSIYYDVKAHPEKYLKAFYKVTELLEIEENKRYNCFPQFYTVSHYFGLKNNSLPYTKTED